MRSLAGADMIAGRNPKQPSDRSAPEKREDTLEIPEVGRCNFTALRKAARRVSQLYDVVLAPCSLRSTQWSILVHIGRSGKPTQTELADSLALDRSTLAHNLKPLERDGLVQVLDDEIDKRSRIVMLTSTGRAKLVESLILWRDAQESIEAIFGVQKAKTLRASLEVLSSKAFTHAFEVLRLRNSGQKTSK
jgi:DNA-binding MarR family transcriptional regulator